jgi:hypothetical protein
LTTPAVVSVNKITDANTKIQEKKTPMRTLFFDIAGTKK